MNVPDLAGAAGTYGSGLPAGAPGNFMFATGIECSYPTSGHGRVRRDQLAECRHYACWREDLGLVRELGLKVLRYGLPYYAVHRGPGRYDWEFTHAVVGEMRRLGITPILDLLHFEQPTSDRGFVTAVKHATAASILATHRIAARRPDCVIVRSESAEYTHDARAEPSAEITLQNKQRFIPLDLLYAHAPDADVGLHLMDNGLARAEYEWFMKGEPPGYQAMGNDYYGRNETITTPDGRSLTAEDATGWYPITREYYRRYRKPVMHTETNVFDAGEAPRGSGNSG